MSAISNSHFDFYKIQLLTLFMFISLKMDYTPLYMVYILLVCFLIEQFYHIIIPILIEKIKILLNRNISKSNFINNISSVKKSSIIIERIYTTNAENDVADSILEYITNYDGTKYIEYKDRFYVTHKNEIKINS